MEDSYLVENWNSSNCKEDTHQWPGPYNALLYSARVSDLGYRFLYMYRSAQVVATNIE